MTSLSPTAAAMPGQALPKERTNTFFRSRRGDSPFKRLLIHLTLIMCCVATVYPLLRVLSVSLRPGDRLLSTSLRIIPPDASLENYRRLLTEKDFLLWVWNSLMITTGTAIVGVALASTSAYAFSRWRFPGRNPGLVFLLTTQMIPAAMLMVNLAATIAGAILIYWIFDKYHWGEPLTVTLVWLFWWPRMWAVRSVGSPETLFILLTVGSLYFFGQKKYWLSGIAGALAVLTKSPGILLLFAYGLALTEKYIKTKSLELKAYPILLIGLAIMGLFVFYGFKTGDFLAYFHSGDNIHLQVLPFKIFDSSQPWVGDFWLEDVLWVYLAGIVGVYYAFKKSRVWGWFGTVFLASIFFVSHRDISRYSLPLIPVVLLGLSDILKRREVKWVLAAMVIPLYFYTLNFVAHNYTAIADWAPFL